MQTIKIAADERIMIPKRVRDQLSWEAGVILIYEVRDSSLTLRALTPEDVR